MEQVGTQASHFRLRIEGVEAHTRFGHRCDERIRQLAGAVAVSHQFDTHAALGSFDQHPLQLLANLVIEDDERFEQDFLLRFADCLEDTGKLLAIDQQLHSVAFSPG